MTRTDTLTPVHPSSARQGLFFGLAAYTVWGFFPVYFKALAGAAPLEIVAHRIAWSVAFLLVVVGARRQYGAILSTLRDRPVLLTLCGSTLLIAGNWLVFLIALERGEVLQSSLGYFITPLVSVLLGTLFLRETLNRWQRGSVALAALGVLTLSLSRGEIPWIALALACTFGLYGLLRKIARVDALVGLTLETLLLAPLAVGYLVLLGHHHQGAFLAGSLRLDLLLPLAGVVTAVPLLLFVGAARRLRLTSIGFLQYITPSLHFVLAVGLFGETFSRAHLLSFLCIWCGLGLYSADALWQGRKGWARVTQETTGPPGMGR